MVEKIYLDVGEGGTIQGWGSSPISSIAENNKEIYLDSQHPFFNESPSIYKYVGGQLVKNTEKQLSEIKSIKSKELSNACQNYILSGFNYAIKDTEYHFSYDQEAQMNLQETDRLFLNDMITSIVWSAGLGNDKARIVLNKKEFNEIYLASVKHKQDAISRFRDKLMPILNQASTVDAVNLINWDVEIVKPSPEPVIFKTNNMIDKQIDDVKVAQAQGNIELLQIMFGMGGMF